MLDYLLYLSLKIEPIFYKIIYMSIIATFVGVTILIVKKMLKNQISPKWISRIWLVFIISLIIPIQIESPISIYNYIPINEDLINYSLDEFIKSEEKSFQKNLNKETSENLEARAETEGIILNFKTNAEEEKINPVTNNYKIRQFIPIIWGLIVISSILAYILTYIVFEIKLRKYKSQNKKLETILNNCKDELNIKNKINLVQQDIIKVPALFGIFNVRVLVNDNILKLSEEETKYVFIHELSHYKRKDNILNILITVLKVIYFFNPIIWISLNVIKNDLELATDELAMEKENRKIQKEYSKTLVKLSAINSDKFLIQTLCVSDGKKNLERRIDSMKKIEKFKENKKIIGVFAVIIIALIGCVFLTRNKNYITYEEIITLTSNIYNLNNLTIKYDVWENGKKINNNIITYYNNNIEVIMDDENNIVSWNDLDTEEYIRIDDFNKNVEIYNTKRMTLFWDDHTENGELGMLKKQGYIYEFLGKKKLEDVNVYEISLHNENEKYNYYINVENGLLMKFVKTEYIDGKEKVLIEKIFNYQFTELNNEIFNEIDLNNYSNYNILKK